MFTRPITKKRGRPKVYGDIHQLNNPATWRAPDESVAFSQTSAKGKIQIIKIDCWNEVIMIGKKGNKLSDYPLRLLRVQVYKESGELLFKRPLWLTAAGKRRMELSLYDIFTSYRHRFDIEHSQPPKPRKKALGRQSGDIQVKRMRHPIVKKWKNTALDEKIIA